MKFLQSSINIYGMPAACHFYGRKKMVNSTNLASELSEFMLLNK